MTVIEVKNTKIVCNKNQSRKDIQRRTIYLKDSDRDFIIYGIKRRDTI